MQKIIIHRGARQIGGMSVEISTDRAKVFIDLGANLPGTNAPAPTVDGLNYGDGTNSALFLTHYHGDHIGLLDTALPEIPIYMGEIAKQILINYAERIRSDRLLLFHKIKPIADMQNIMVGDIVVTPIPQTDHSAFDAYMYVIEAGGYRILHTGDFRFHGIQGKTTLKMLNRYAKNIDYIICEGTLLSRDGAPSMTEQELGRKAEKLMETCPYVFVVCSSTHIERLASFYKANPKGRFFICDSYQKKQLATVANAYDWGKKGYYNFKHIYDYAPNLDAHMKEKGFCMIVRQGKAFEHVMEKYRDSCLVIYSMWTGYLDERSKNKALVDFLAQYKYHTLHTSGHATNEDLKRLYDTVKPRCGLIPIHTDAPEKFGDIVPAEKLFLLDDGEVLQLKDRKSCNSNRKRGKKMAYSRNEIIDKVKKALKNSEKAYRCGVWNYRGPRTGERYTEIAAQELMKKENLSILNGIRQIDRENYYVPDHHDTKKHSEDAKPENTTQEEKWIAKGLYGKTITGLGKIIDFETPLSRVKIDNAGEIDLLAYNESTCETYLLELKKPHSTETLLRCILEIFTYCKTVNEMNLLGSFSVIKGNTLRKAVLVYENSKAYKDFKSSKCTFVRRLMKELCVDLFVLSADNSEIIFLYLHEWEADY